MKKNKKILIIALAAALVLVGILLFLIFYKPSSNPMDSIDKGISMSTSTDDEGVHQAKINTDKDGNIKNNSYGTLLDYVPAKIKKIHLENNSGTLDVTSYTPKDSSGKTKTTEYKLVGFENLAIQSGKPDEIANDASSLEFAKVMTLKKSESSKYGFDKPVATATVTYTDNTKGIIIVGSNAPQGAGTYVKFGSGDTVYLVESGAVDSFSYSINDLISLTINNSAADSAKSQASSITITGTNFSDKIVLEPNTNKNNSATYVMTSPVKEYANESASSKVDGAIRGLYGESVKMVNPSEKQLASLGLDKPYAEIKAVYPDTTVHLITSKPDGSGKVYIMESGGKIVYKMASANLPWVTTSYSKLASEYVLHPQLTALSKMSVNNGKKTYDFTLSSKQTTSTDNSGSETNSTTTTVKCGKEEIQLSYFSTFFQNVSLLERADVEKGSTSGSPVFAVTYTYSSDNSTDTVKFYKTSGNRYLATVNDSVVGHVYKSDINKLIDQVEDVAKNKQVSSFS